ncbi:MAG: class I SAM-dependent methyltransferase [Dehalococcoidia bacterium]
MAAEELHWTHKLFVEHAELFLPFLEAAKDRAPAEVEVLLNKFNEFGVPQNAKVLDLACGIGRHSIPLSQQGYTVVGFELSPLYVQKAGEQAKEAGIDAAFVQGDVRNVSHLLEDHAPFDAIINMFTSHGYYGKESDLKLFSALHELAAPNALLIVETANRDFLVRHFQQDGLMESPTVQIQEHRKFNYETSCMEVTWELFQRQGDDLKHRLSLDLKLRAYSLHELRGVLEEAGWVYLTGLSRREETTEMVPLSPDQLRMWVVARA